MSFRVRFSQERPDVHHLPPLQSDKTGLAKDLFALPLPPVHQEVNFQMDMHTAASIGEQNIIKLLLRNGADVNKPNKSGWRPLLYAAYLGHADTCKLLLDSQAEVDAPSSTGQTPLMVASACGNLSVVDVLLSRGASGLITDKGGRSPLHYAASCSQNKVVDCLLQSGCDPNLRDENGMTPVLEACQAAHELTLDSLLKKGGNAYIKNSRGEDGEAFASDAPKILQMVKNSRRIESGPSDARPNDDYNSGPSQGRQPETLEELLMAMQLERYLQKFEQEHIDLKLFFSLTDKDLEDMGVAYGPKKRMRAVIDRYRNTGVVAVDIAVGLPPAPPSYSQIVPEGRTVTVSGMPADQFGFARSILESTQMLASEAVEVLGNDETSDRLRPLLNGIKDGLQQVLARMQRTV